MIPQYVAAALVSENKALCHPASVDSIPTSAGQEDHVSMGNGAGPQGAPGRRERRARTRDRAPRGRAGGRVPRAARAGRRCSGRARVRPDAVRAPPRGQAAVGRHRARCVRDRRRRSCERVVTTRWRTSTSERPAAAPASRIGRRDAPRRARRRDPRLRGPHRRRPDAGGGVRGAATSSLATGVDLVPLPTARGRRRRRRAGGNGKANGRPTSRNGDS